MPLPVAHRYAWMHRAQPEDAIQAGIVEYLRLVLLAERYVTFAIPNGGKRGVAEARRMKMTGTLAGMPDLMIVGPGGSSWWLEVKTADGSLSPKQREMRAWAIETGVPHAVVRSIDEVNEALRLWGVPTREATTTTRAAS